MRRHNGLKSGKVASFVNFAQHVEAYWGYLEENYPGTFPPRMLDRLRYIMKEYGVEKICSFDVMDHKLSDMIEEMSKLHPGYKGKS